MQDMVPPKNRSSIRDIPVSVNGRRPLLSTQDEHVQEQEQIISKISEYSSMLPLETAQNSRSNTSILSWATGIIVTCVIAVVFISTLFQSVTVVVTVKTQTVTPPATIEALTSVPAGSLAYQTISVTQTASTTVPASGTERVSKQAMGTIIISNSYSTASQKLITNTRFEASDGKMYRIHTAITVPGATKGATGALSAGTATATIYADVAGVEYNRDAPTSFTIPGFKKDTRYTKFTVQSQGPIVGGFVGEQPAIALSDLAKAEETLKQQLDLSIATAIAAATPSGFIIVKNSLTTVYSPIAKTSGVGTEITLSETVTVSQVIVRADDLASVVAKQTVTDYMGESVSFVDQSQIHVSIAPDMNKATGPLTIALSGSPTLVWQFDQAAFKQALIGKKKADLQAIIQLFKPAIKEATTNIRPFWKSTFPVDASKLIVMVK